MTATSTEQIGSYSAEILQSILDRAGVKCHSIFIAGGAAAHLIKSGDIDVWFGNNQQDLARKFLSNLPYHHIFNESKGYNETGGLLGEGYTGDFPHKPIQVLSTGFKTAQELMDTDFDISTHMVAYTSRGVGIRGKHWTPITEQPLLIKHHNKSFSRYIKICSRYGFVPDPKVLAAFESNLKDYNKYHGAIFGLFDEQAAKDTFALAQAAQEIPWEPDFYEESPF